MHLLDTNVVSELRRGRPHRAVLNWFGNARQAPMYVSAVSIGEIQKGIEITRRQDSQRAAELEVWTDTVIATYNVLPMNHLCFREWARLMHGKSNDVSMDGMIAATAIVYGLTVVTRNVRDFVDFGVLIVNPFDA